MNFTKTTLVTLSTRLKEREIMAPITTLHLKNLLLKNKQAFQISILNPDGEEEFAMVKSYDEDNDVFEIALLDGLSGEEVAYSELYGDTAYDYEIVV